MQERNRLLAISIGMAFAIIIAPQPLSAKPAVTIRTNYYPVQGTTVEQLRTEMNRNGPMGNWAYTNWYVSWSAPCKVTLRVVYTYPRWINRDAASASFRQYWDKFMASLQVHEKGHEQNGRNAAPAVDKARCNNSSGAIVQKWVNQDKIYDATTNHGTTQGAVF